MRCQFQSVIQSLSEEIEMLSSERIKLLDDMEISSTKTDDKTHKKMRDRITALEKKIKDLHSKSKEHQKALRQREIAEKKCAQLQAEIKEDKKRRVSLQRRLKEEASERKNERSIARKEAAKLLRDGNRLKLEMTKIKDTAAKQATVLRRKAADASAKLKAETERKRRHQRANETKSFLSISQSQKGRIMTWLEREIDMGEVIRSTKSQLEEEMDLISIAREKKETLLDDQERGDDVTKELQPINDEINARSIALNHLQRSLDEIISTSKDFDGLFIDKKTWEGLSRNELRFSIISLFESLMHNKKEYKDNIEKAEERLLVAVNKALQDERQKSKEALMLVKMDHSESMMTLMNTTKDALSQKVEKEMIHEYNGTDIDQYTKSNIDKMLEHYLKDCGNIGKKLHDDLREVKEAHDGMKEIYDEIAQGVMMKPPTKKRKKRVSESYELDDSILNDDTPEAIDSDDSDWSPNSPAASKKIKTTSSGQTLPERKPSDATSEHRPLYSDESLKPLPTDLNTLKVSELKELLRERKLPISGRKCELLERLKTVLSPNDNHDINDTLSTDSIKNKEASRTPLQPIQQNKIISTNSDKSSVRKVSKSSARKRRRDINTMLSKTLIEVENSLVI